MEHRPYWWVKERELLVEHAYPVLQQTRLSCETGPGSPSGHVMGSTAVLFAIVASLDEILSKSRKISHRTKAAGKYILWILFGASLILIAMSRLYTATHFPHQCFLGFLGGLYVAKSLLLDTKMSTWWRNSKRPKVLLAALGMTMISFGAYWLQKGLGIDPQWSVKLAFKWCSKPDWIHVNTTPLFSLVRDCGAAFGIALISPVSMRYTSLGTSSCIVKGVLIGGVMVAMHLAQAAIPIGHVLTFYLCQFMLYAVQPYIYLVIVPFLATQQKVTNKSD
ncbi:glucose-6-phosphatase isoform X2 [Cephus cinctus]|nr:glucose-6-phosphatase isoform X2 [Cephus cinctus]XP_024944510.1 glucose-6-phosphatase isoform X2 [Cephus cinctus]